MNKIKAVLKNIISTDSLNLLEFEVNSFFIKALILQNNLELKLNQMAFISIKSTKLFLSKDKFEFENRLEVNIKSIKKGKILANIVCEFDGVNIEVLMLKEYINFEDRAYLYFKANDVFVEVLDD